MPDTKMGLGGGSRSGLCAQLLVCTTHKETSLLCRHVGVEHETYWLRSLQRVVVSLEAESAVKVILYSTGGGGSPLIPKIKYFKIQPLTFSYLRLLVNAYMWTSYRGLLGDFPLSRPHSLPEGCLSPWLTLPHSGSCAGVCVFCVLSLFLLHQCSRTSCVPCCLYNFCSDGEKEKYWTGKKVTPGFCKVHV